MKKEVVWWFVIAISVILFAVALKFFVFNNVKGIEYSCRANEDCLLVKDSCCSCLHIKKQVEVINKNSEAEWEKHLRCGGVAVCEPCPEEAQLGVGCVSGKCKVI